MSPTFISTSLQSTWHPLLSASIHSANNWWKSRTICLKSSTISWNKVMMCFWRKRWSIFRMSDSKSSSSAWTICERSSKTEGLKRSDGWKRQRLERSIWGPKSGNDLKNMGRRSPEFDVKTLGSWYRRTGLTECWVASEWPCSVRLSGERTTLSMWNLHKVPHGKKGLRHPWVYHSMASVHC